MRPSGWHADIRIRLPILSMVMASALLCRLWTVQDTFRGAASRRMLWHNMATVGGLPLLPQNR